MQRRISFLTDESGQTLIYVAISMFVLLGFVALAVDVGHVYAERRQMQNAADAGALEAARALCFGVNVAASDAAATGAAFMQANNSRPDALSQTYTVVPNALNMWEFDATAEEVARLYFAGVIGVAPIRVQATARAACGSTQKACGMFPLAFDKAIWDGIANQCGKTFYAWTSDLDKLNGNNDAGDAPNCTTCDCDRVYIQNKLQPGAIAIAEVGRAWLDFTSATTALNPDSCSESNGCGANELKCWVRNSSPVQFSLPQCVSGTSGVKLGVRNEVNGRVGDYVSLPIFSGRCTPSEGGDCKEGFKVVQFGCMQEQRWDNKPIELEWRLTPTPPPHGNPNPGRCWKGQMMPVTVACNKCDTECGSTTGGGNPGSGIKAVSLIK